MQRKRNSTVQKLRLAKRITGGCSTFSCQGMRMKELEPNRDAGHVDHSLWHKICANMHEQFNQGNTEHVGYDISCVHGRVCTQNCFSGKIFEQSCGSLVSEYQFFFMVHMHVLLEKNLLLQKKNIAMFRTYNNAWNNVCDIVSLNK